MLCQTAIMITLVNSSMHTRISRDLGSDRHARNVPRPSYEVLHSGSPRLKKRVVGKIWGAEGFQFFLDLRHYGARV